ncbi:hypothetical protein GQX74_002330 [Glossina fuscipes]|nr:hypothetical protein GQX74_002330 [Glossina fuscipes]
MFCFVSEFAKESSNERETTCRYHYHFGEICNCACVFKPKRLLMRRQRKRLETVDENIYLISLYHDEIQCVCSIKEIHDYILFNADFGFPNSNHTKLLLTAYSFMSLSIAKICNTRDHLAMSLVATKKKSQASGSPTKNILLLVKPSSNFLV